LYFSGERGAEFVNPQDITRDNGNYLTASMLEEFLQIFCAKPVRKKPFIPSTAIHKD
jgi:hypothetical protein